MTMSTDTVPAGRTMTRNRWMLLLFLALLLAPILLVQFALYQGWLDGSERTTNHGERMQPPVGLVQLNPASDSALITSGDLSTSWWVLYVVPESCLETCERQLRQLQQATDNLDVSQPVQQLLLDPHTRDEALTDWLDSLEQEQRPHRVSVSARAVDHALAGWVAENQPASEANYFYLMNPQGSLMMNYPPMEDDELSALRLREDLERLLRSRE